MAAVPHHVSTPWPGHGLRSYRIWSPGSIDPALAALAARAVRAVQRARAPLVVLAFAVAVACLSAGLAGPSSAGSDPAPPMRTTAVAPIRGGDATPVAEPVTMPLGGSGPSSTSAPATTAPTPTAPTTSSPLPTTWSPPTSARVPATTSPTSPPTAPASTRAPAPAGVLTASAPGVWQALAACESGGNWTAQSGGFEGGLQFSPATWQAMGGTQFAVHAYWASPTQQVVVAERVRAANGGSYRAWPVCAARLGLP